MVGRSDKISSPPLQLTKAVLHATAVRAPGNLETDKCGPFVDVAESVPNPGLRDEVRVLVSF